MKSQFRNIESAWMSKIKKWIDIYHTKMKECFQNGGPKVKIDLNLIL